MHKKLFYLIPGILGLALFIGGLALVDEPLKKGEAIFMLIIGAAFLFVSYRKLVLKKGIRDSNEAEDEEEDN